MIPSVMAGAPGSVHRPSDGFQVDPRDEVHPSVEACADGSPPASVGCHHTEKVDREDHPSHHDSAVPSARSRSPRLKTGLPSELEALAGEVLKVFESLPADSLRRGQNSAIGTTRSYSTGAYVLGGNVGLKANASSRPDVLELFSKFVNLCVPGFQYTSINVFQDVCTEPHQDQWNANLHNLAIPVTQFSGGAIFVEHPGGPDFSRNTGSAGTRLDVSAGPVVFDARHCSHHTEAWHGRRVVLVAYTIRHVASLSREHKAFLEQCGVKVPGTAPEDVALVPAKFVGFSPYPSLGKRPARPSKPPLTSPKVPPPAEGSLGSPGLGHGELNRPLKPSSAVFLDIKCGSGLLSARMRKDGFQVIATEHGRPSGRVHIHVVPVDVETEAGFSFLQTVVTQDRPFHVHFYPATKDCFKLAMPAHKSVQLANLLQASQLGWSILHPSQSGFWAQLDVVNDVHAVHFCSGCMGAANPVQMRLLTNQACLVGWPAPTCTCKRGQLPAGALSPDVIYTQRFCDLFAGLLQLAVGQAGLLLEHACPVQGSSQASQVATGKQPKLSKYQPQIAEFKCQAVVHDFPWPLPLDEKGNLRRAVGSVPTGSRLLRVTSDGGVVAAKKTQSLTGKPSSVTFGIYRTDHEFVAQALSLDHPFDLCVAVPDFMLKTLAFTLKEGPLGVMRHRINLLKLWSSWKVQLSEDEAKLHEMMEPGVAAVMRGKNILLLEKIASSFEWPDESVFEHLKRGFPLVGESSPSGIFDVDRKPASLTREELLQHAKFLRPALWAKVANSKLDEAASHVWEATQIELVEKGWLTGPYSWDNLQERFPGGWLPVRRFGLAQKDKTRSIDDLAENSVNRAYAVSDKISLRALDELVWTALTLFRIFLTKGEVAIPLSSGQMLRFPVHSFWRTLKPEGLQPSIKTVDLKSAYKQLAVLPGDRCLSVVTVKDPMSGMALGFESRTLLFGATSSVTSFNRVARLLQRVLVELQVMAFNYFDDYPVLELLPLCNNTQSTICAILDMLGYVWAKDKDRPFQAEADLLGIRVDLSCFGVVKIKNKPDRAESIASAVDSVLAEGVMDPKILPSLFGRIQFAEGQLHGRMGRLALADVRSCTLQAKSQTLDVIAKRALTNLKARVLGGTPRIVPAVVGHRRSVIFTDGAYEPTSASHPATVGGILYHYDQGAWCTFYFACAISLSIVQNWEALGKRHLIGPVEMYAVLCARSAWSRHMDSHRVTIYVDHSGVLASLVKGSSRDPLWRQLLLLFEQLDERATLPWFSRVPSLSNPSDPPSRGKSTFPVRGRLERARPVCPVEGIATQDLPLS